MSYQQPPPPPPPAPAVPPGLGMEPVPSKKKMFLGTPFVIALAVVAAVGAYFAVTRATDRRPPTQAEVSAAFAPLPDLEYGEMPSEAMAALETAFTSQAGEETVATFDAREVLRAGESVAVVFVLSVDPDDMQGDFEDQYVTGFTSTSQATVVDIDVGDTRGYMAATPLGTVAFFFDGDGLVFNVVGRDNPTVEGIARTLEAFNS